MDLNPPDPILIRFDAGGTVPNNPILPVVLLRGAMGSTPSADDICTQFELNGWRNTWTWSVFDYHHFHPDTHEALGVASGWADICLGGPDGQTIRFNRGDVAILPAGTGHCRLNSSDDFAMCGGYPPGQNDYQTCRAGEFNKDVLQCIAAVPIPATDPVFGKHGPLIAAWHKNRKGR